MTNTYVDMDGVENVAVSVIKQAKKDFVKGAKILYGVLGNVPTEKELMRNPTHMTLANDRDVRYMYDSWRFVIKDPYSMFGEVGEDTVINSWKQAAIIDHYKDLYISGAEAIYRNEGWDHTAGNKTDCDKRKKKVQPYQFSESRIKKLISDKKLCDDFIAARDYICSIKHEFLFEEWEKTAKDRTRKKDKKSICERRKQQVEKKLQRQKEMAEKAMELKKEGFTISGIANAFGVSERTIRNYIHDNS